MRGCATAPRDPRQRGERVVELRSQCIDADTELLQHRNRRALGLIEQRVQQMHGFDDTVSAARCERLRFRECFLAFDRQFVELHGLQP